MAKRTKTANGANVSGAIRDFLQANPDAKAKEVADAVSQTVGKTVSANYVYMIKSKMGGKAGKAGNGHGSRRSSSAKQELPIQQRIKLALNLLDAFDNDWQLASSLLEAVAETKRHLHNSSAK